MRRTFAALLIAVAFVACSDDDDSPSDGATSTTAPVGPTGTRNPTTTLDGSLTPVSTPPTEYRYLKAVRVGVHEGFDRVVFEFESGVPGYSVKYVDRPITEDGSGNEVDVDGAAVLSVRMEAASGADLSGAQLRQTYTDKTRIDGPAGGVVDELVRTGDFEAVLNWVVGVKTQAPFKVYTSEGNKLVIDIAHAA